MGAEGRGASEEERDEETEEVRRGEAFHSGGEEWSRRDGEGERRAGEVGANSPIGGGAKIRKRSGGTPPTFGLKETGVGERRPYTEA